MSKHEKVRMEKIVEWLEEARDVALQLRNLDGFYVKAGTMLRLKDGREVDALEWLSDEGFRDGMIIAGYSLKYAPASEKYSEKLTFFKLYSMAQAPF